MQLCVILITTLMVFYLHCVSLEVRFYGLCFIYRAFGGHYQGEGGWNLP